MIGIFKPGGKFIVYCFNKDGSLSWEEKFHNKNVDQGLSDILSVYFASGTQKTNWYIGIKGSNETPLGTWTSASVDVDFTEFKGYDELTRPRWIPGAVSGNSMSNVLNLASYTINNESLLFGAFIISVNTKGGQTGIMWCCANFNISQNVVVGQNIKIQYTVGSQDA